MKNPEPPESKHKKLHVTKNGKTWFDERQKAKTFGCAWTSNKLPRGDHAEVTPIPPPPHGVQRSRPTTWGATEPSNNTGCNGVIRQYRVQRSRPTTRGGNGAVRQHGVQQSHPTIQGATEPSNNTWGEWSRPTTRGATKSSDNTGCKGAVQ